LVTGVSKFLSEQRQFEQWLPEAVAALRIDDLGRLLVDKNAHISRRIRVAGTLGLLRREEAVVYLRQALESTDKADLACPIIVSLGRILGAGATQDVRPFLDSRSATIRQFAFDVEGYVGDLSIEERMMAEWAKITKAANGRQPLSTTGVLRYLGRHFESFEPTLQSRILREGPRVCERASSKGWIERYWPGLCGTGAPGPSRRLVSEVIDDMGRPPDLSTEEWMARLLRRGLVDADMRDTDPD
jgi:hypothetical protein